MAAQTGSLFTSISALELGGSGAQDRAGERVLKREPWAPSQAEPDRPKDGEIT